nr:hypothetical protein [Angustibacter aerolatus]
MSTIGQPYVPEQFAFKGVEESHVPLTTGPLPAAPTVAMMAPQVASSAYKRASTEQSSEQDVPINEPADRHDRDRRLRPAPHLRRPAHGAHEGRVAAARRARGHDAAGAAALDLRDALAEAARAVRERARAWTSPTRCPAARASA